MNAKDPAGSTLLHHAAGFGAARHDDVAAGCRRGRQREEPARLDAAALGHPRRGQGAPAAVARRDVNARQVEGRTPLYQAASLGNGTAIVRLLLATGADPNIATANGRTPLMAAAGRGDVEAMRLLLDAKASVDAQERRRRDRADAGRRRRQSGGRGLLLDRGADARVRTKRNETALGNAGTAGNEETVRLLLEHGADVNVRNIRGYSPLMLAASSDTIPAGVVKLLLAKGADTSFNGDYDETARDLAAKRGDTDVTRLLGGRPRTGECGDGRARFGMRRRSHPGRGRAGARRWSRSKATTSSASAGATRVTRRICRRPRPPSRAAADLSAPQIPQLPQSMMPSPSASWT